MGQVRSGCLLEIGVHGVIHVIYLTTFVDLLLHPATTPGSAVLHAMERPQGCNVCWGSGVIKRELPLAVSAPTGISTPMSGRAQG